MNRNKYIISALISVCVLALTIKYFYFKEHNTRTETFTPHIEAKKKEIKDITTDIKERSKQSVKKGDSLVKLLEKQPWKLSNEDMKDGTIVNYLKNYRYEE